MKKIDISVLAIVLIMSILCSLMPCKIVLATNNEEEITFKDKAFEDFLKNRGADKDNNGKITIAEMESIDSLYIYYSDMYKFKNIEEIKYAKNLRNLTIGDMDLQTLDLTSFVKLQYFEFICKDENSVPKKENLKIPNNLFLYETVQYYSKKHVIRGFNVSDQTIFIGEKCNINPNCATFPEEDIIKQENGGILGIKEGVAKIKYESSLDSKELTITVKKSDLNSNPKLDETGITARFMDSIRYDQEKILQSNGNLWSFDGKSNFVVEDTNVKDTVAIYSRNNNSYMSYYLKLKNDNILYILENQNKEPKKINDVKQIVQGSAEAYSAYLTTNNELYYINPSQSGEKVYQKVDDNVEKIMGSFYIKGGKTYFVNGQKVLDSEIDNARKSFAVKGNTLYAYNFINNANELFTVDTEFKNFLYEEGQDWSAVNPVYITTNGEKKQANFKRKEPSEYRRVNRQSFYYYANNDKEYSIFLGEEDNLYIEKDLLLLTNIYNANIYYAEEEDNEYIVAIRKDGSIWMNTPENAKEFKKVEQEQNEEVDSDKLVEEFGNILPEFTINQQTTNVIRRAFSEIEITSEQQKEFMARANELKQLLDNEGVNSLNDLPEEKTEEGKQIFKKMINAVGLEVKFQNGGIQFFKPNGDLIISSTSEHMVSEETKGDIDEDGDITSFDAYKALEFSLSSEELTEDQIKLLDIDKDGVVTSFDAYLILSYSVGIIDEKYWGTGNL